MAEKQLISDLQHRIALCEDMKAYRRLYELLYERLFWFSFFFVKSREVAEEIGSDVFIKIWNIRDELYISAGLGKKIREAIGQLPAQCRLVFQMVREDGLKPKETLPP